MRKQFLAGFLACYLLGAVGYARGAAEIPATTPAGAVWAGVIWLPFQLVPRSWAPKMVPTWVFDFDAD